jgi:ferric-dicitrate binding protein FerR (iron transport regulator)
MSETLPAPEAEPPATEPVRRPRPAPRRRWRGVGLVTALVAVVVALAIGIVVGWAARGDDPPAKPVIVDRDVPVVTVTVPASTAP